MKITKENRASLVAQWLKKNQNKKTKNKKTLSANAGDMGSIPGLGRSTGEGNGNPLQYSCLGNLMDRATVHGVTEESDMT